MRKTVNAFGTFQLLGFGSVPVTLDALRRWLVPQYAAAPRRRANSTSASATETVVVKPTREVYV